jgi:hypothetical protein
VELHVHTYASLLDVGALLAQNIGWKRDQLVVCVFKFLNNVKQNHYTTKEGALTMVFELHKFKHYILENNFLFYVYHMALIYLINKPHVSRIIAWWLLLFLEYDFTIVYKLSKIHVVANV